MTWERAKRWLAKHPAVTLTPLMLIATYIFFIVVGLTEGVADGRFPLDNLVISVAMAILATGMLLAWSFWLGVQLERSGLSAGPRLRKGALLGCLIVAALLLLPMGAMCAYGLFVASGKESPEEFRSTVRGTEMAMVVVAGSPVVALLIVVLGSAMASRMARRKLASGQCETTVPVPPDVDRKDGDPAVTLTPLMLFATCTFFILVGAIDGMANGTFRPEILVIWVAMAILATGMLLAWSFWLGVQLERSGLSAGPRLRKGALWGCLFVAPLILLPVWAIGAFARLITSGRPSDHSTDTGYAMAMVRAAASPVVALLIVLLGSAMASRTARRKLASGQWETPVPAPPNVDSL